MGLLAAIPKQIMHLQGMRKIKAESKRGRKEGKTCGERERGGE